MERESFENEQVAALLNESFVCVKVDREERPDIDAVYMEAARAMSGGGGWPLTIIMTPDGRPFFSATYIPRTSRFGMPGMLDLVPRIAELWRTRRDDLVETAGHVADAISDTTEIPSAGELSADVLDEAYRHLRAAFDGARGGFGNAPKFPTPHQLLFLLRYWRRTGNRDALGMVENSLSAMRRGGIYDQLGFGFHRYSTDAEWLLPHFEKMLYDQAMHVMALTEARLATGERSYERTAREIIEYVLRDMTDESGGFYSAEDADSEGVEGKFYVWNLSEVRRVLGPDDADVAERVFGLSEGGNVRDEASGRETGANVLRLVEPVDVLAERSGLAPDALTDRLESVRERLLRARADRVRPRLDDKVLTDWNGLMIAALARAAQAFDEPRYAESAAGCADFILGALRDRTGRLLHRYRDGDAAIPGGADDYAFLSLGLFDLYEATHRIVYLAEAARLTDQMIALFWDETACGFFSTPHDGERLLARRKELYDGALPSANSVALLNLLRLGDALARPDLAELASSLASAFSGAVAAHPSAYTMFLSALDYALGPSVEIVVVGRPQDQEARALLGAVRSSFVPNKVVLQRPIHDAQEILDVVPWLGQHGQVGGRATAYVCLDGACGLPVTDAESLRQALSGRGAGQSAPEGDSET
jgi:uncharacterized protein YyaL (SSP411 family)